MFTMIFYLNGNRIFEQKVNVGVPIPRSGELVTINNTSYCVYAVRHDYGDSKRRGNPLTVHFHCRPGSMMLNYENKEE